MFVFAPSFFFTTLFSVSEFAVEDSADVCFGDVGAFEALDSESCSSSTPNDSFPLPIAFRFFLNIGLGVVVLYLVN